MPKSPPSQFSAGKRFVQKELPPKAHSQVQLARAKLRQGLAVVLSMDSDHQFGQQSAGNVPALGSAGGNMEAAGGRTQGSTTAFQDAGKDNAGNVTKVATTRSEDSDISHVPLENKVSGNSSVALDDLLQDQGLCWAPDTIVGPSESLSQTSRKRAGHLMLTLALIYLRPGQNEKEQLLVMRQLKKKRSGFIRPKLCRLELKRSCSNYLEELIRTTRRMVYRFCTV
jgi:hypothetical protein